jgi:hypothetical protein
MEFLILLFFFFIIVSVVKSEAGKAKAKLPPAAFYDPSQIPPEHVLRVSGGPAAVLPARTASEESSSELMWDELSGDTEVDSTGVTLAEVVSLERTDVMSVEARPMPAEAVTLEHEVDWEVEHELFHRKYVDGHSAGSAARHGLLDEMRDPGALRRAVLMAEILGPPKSLRK